MCEEESDDAEAVRKLLEINDSIHRTIERYKLVKKGDFDGASRIPKGTLGTSTGVSKTANNELSLIDFDPEPSSNGNASAAAAPAPQGTSSLENDLLGLSFQDQPQAPSGSVSLGFSKYLTCKTSEIKITDLVDRHLHPTIFVSNSPYPAATSSCQAELRYSVFPELVSPFFTNYHACTFPFATAASRNTNTTASRSVCFSGVGQPPSIIPFCTTGPEWSTSVFSA